MNEIMKGGTLFTLFYFSGSGNTKILTETLADRLKEHDRKIKVLKIADFLRKDTPDSGEELRSIIEDGRDREEKSHIIILYPVYAFDAPTIVYNFIRTLPDLSGRTSDTVSVSIIFSPCDPHRINSAAAFKVRRKLEKKGYSILREDMMVMPSNFVVGYPEALAAQLMRTAGKKLAEIARSLAEGRRSRVVPSPVARVLQLIFKIEHPGAALFGKDLKAGPDCTLCGLCAEECPRENIRIENGRVRFGWSCILCMHCVYRCPVNAIAPRIHRFIPIRGGYRPEEIAGLPAGENFVTMETKGFYAHFSDYLFENEQESPVKS